MSSEQLLSVSMAPACFCGLTRTEHLFLEGGERGINAIPVVFLDGYLVTGGVKVC